MATDIVILTDARYVNPKEPNWYVQNILHEDALLSKALKAKGLNVLRTNWDNPNFNWTETKYALFRATWDYFDRFAEFTLWLEKTKTQTQFINPIELIKWNIDKHYLGDLQKKGINIPNTIFIEKGDANALETHFENAGFRQAILKPAIAGAARHTYKIDAENVSTLSGVFSSLIKAEAMLLQEFQESISEKGEISVVLFGQNYSHAVLKKAKPGDFRVQDDFGGTLHDHLPSQAELLFAQKVISQLEPKPVYARVDMLWDNKGELALGEVELIEPELWFRREKNAADLLANEIVKRFF